MAHNVRVGMKDKHVWRKLKKSQSANTFVTQDLIFSSPKTIKNRLTYMGYIQIEREEESNG